MDAEAHNARVARHRRLVERVGRDLQTAGALLPLYVVDADAETRVSRLTRGVHWLARYQTMCGQDESTRWLLPDGRTVGRDEALDNLLDRVEGALAVET